MNQAIITQASSLRRRLKKGTVNFFELDSFLAQIEQNSKEKPARKLDDRFAQHLENLTNGFTKKPLVNTR
jgi:hypothetical protein